MIRDRDGRRKDAARDQCGIIEREVRAVQLRGSSRNPCTRHDRRRGRVVHARACSTGSTRTRGTPRSPPSAIASSTAARTTTSRSRSPRRFCETLDELIPFAPNHLPDEIALIEAIGRWRPDVPQIACFDTAFHHDLPDVARRLPIPRVVRRRRASAGTAFTDCRTRSSSRSCARLAGPAAARGRRDPRASRQRIEPGRRPGRTQHRHHAWASRRSAASS